MDFWEVMKVAARRWAVTVPVLVVTLLVAVLVPPRIDPTYAAATSTAVISPLEADPADNPYLSLGPVAMAQGLVASGGGPAAMATISAAGGSDDYTVRIQNSRSPLLLVNVNAPTPELASSTAAMVLDQLRTQLAERQTAAGAPPDAQYYTQDLLQEAVAVPVYDGAQRVRFLALGLGVGLAVTLALALEGVAVLRQRRRLGYDGSGRSLVEQRLEMLDDREQLLRERERLVRQQEEEEASFGRWAGPAAGHVPTARRSPWPRLSRSAHPAGDLADRGDAGEPVPGDERHGIPSRG